MVSAALSLLLTAFNPYPVAPPGTSPWADKSGYSGGAFLAAFALMFLGWIPVAPGVVLFLLGYQVLGIAIALIVPAAIYGGVIALVSKNVASRMLKDYAKAGSWVIYKEGSF